jgi:HEAT repeat protein
VKEHTQVTIKRVVEYHISRLKDKNPDVRIKAIKELELLADPAALEPLRDLYDNDDNIDVRKAAHTAGRTLFLKTRSSNNT